MAYSKTNWVNENEPAINADNLNKIESGIEDNSLQLESYGRTINELVDNKVETNAIKNEASTEDDEIYSSNYLNDKLVSVGATAPENGERVWFGKSKNLININNITVKKYVNRSGQLANSDDWSATGFVKIQPNTTYTLSGITNSGTTAKICFYEKQNVSNFISAINSTEYTFTTPNNANYIRLSLNSETPTSAMLEEGSTASTFEPYIEPSINVDGEELHFDNYSTSEQVIGKWIDGKPLYRKVITFGALVNNGNKVIPYGSSNNLIKFDIYAKNPTSGYLFKVPLGGSNYINSYVDLNSHQIVVQTNSDRTNVTDNYVIVEYTKTTD